MNTKLRAEVLSIGDEMTSGQRLDTNAQWISQQLGDLGIEVAFHSTVGDNLDDNIDVFRIATNRADLVICTGGLGPTADDLTREAIAKMANVELEYHEHVVTHIQKLFQRYAKEMPESNRSQAWFPAGSQIIDNPEGTAPGIDLAISRPNRQSRIFALPGVPYEMKAMWRDCVEPELRAMAGQDGTIHHHVIHCFGMGESQTEALLPDLIKRGREPRVGITASLATISLRISAQAESVEACQQLMEPTIQQIRDVLGDMIFGENNTELVDVVGQLLSAFKLKIAIVDAFFGGEIANEIRKQEQTQNTPLLANCRVLDLAESQHWPRNFCDDRGNLDLTLAAEKIKSNSSAEVGIAIGPLNQTDQNGQMGNYTIVIATDEASRKIDLVYGGHSELRHIRSVKQVLNEIRLFLQDPVENLSN